MVKVQILTTCDFCEGDAYLPEGEAESYSGEKNIIAIKSVHAVMVQAREQNGLT